MRRSSSSPDRKIDFFPAEIDALKKYLDKSGKLLLELDPPDKPDSPPLTNLIALAHDWGIDVGNNIVVDASGMGRLIGTDASVPVAANYPSHPITQRFNFLTAYPLARSVDAGERRRQRTHRAELRRDEPAKLGGNGHQGADDDAARCRSTSEGRQEGADRDCRGGVGAPRRAGAEAGASRPTRRSPKPASSVFGDSDFAANGALGIQGNRDLFMNTIGWLSQQENLISIRPKEADDRRLTLTAAQQTNIMLLSLLIIPGCIFGTGVYTWWRRR